MKFSTGYAIIFILLVISCSEGPKDEDSRIDESMVVRKNDNEPRKYVIDSAGSFISWAGANDRIRHYGIFHIDHGYVTFQDSALTGGEIYISLSDMNILDLKDNPEENSRLSEFIESKDFFDVKNFPLAEFRIDSVREINIPIEELVKSRMDKATSPTDTVYGRLTIKGITMPVKFPARIDMRYYSLQSSAKFKLYRDNWDLNAADRSRMSENGPVPDSIEVGFDIIANSR